MIIKKEDALLGRQPRGPNLSKKGALELRKECRAREEYFLVKAHEAIQRFLDRYGSLPNFKIAPKKMVEYEEAMARASRAGDARLLEDLGRQYLSRVLDYLDLWRGRYWKTIEEEDRLRLIDLGEIPPDSPPRPAQGRLSF